MYLFKPLENSFFKERNITNILTGDKMESDNIFNESNRRQKGSKNETKTR